jgi:hypothetical protein
MNIQTEKIEEDTLSNSKNSWFYEHHGGREGPVNSESIKQLVVDSTLNMDSLVWKQGMENWTAIKFTDLSTLIPEDISPPPLKVSSVDSIVWWLAFAPLIGNILQGFLSELLVISHNKLWIVTIALNTLLSYLDEKKLRKAGYDTKKFGNSFLVPVYLHNRYKILNQENTYFMIWMFLFVVFLFVSKN